MASSYPSDTACSPVDVRPARSATAAVTAKTTTTTTKAAGADVFGRLLRLYRYFSAVRETRKDTFAKPAVINGCNAEQRALMAVEGTTTVRVPQRFLFSVQLIRHDMLPTEVLIPLTVVAT